MNHHFINSILQWLLIAIVLTAIGALVLGVVADGGKGPTVIGLLIGGALIWAEHYTKKRAEKHDVLEMETSADKAEDGTDALPASEEAPTESYRIEREDNFSTAIEALTHQEIAAGQNRVLAFEDSMVYAYELTEVGLLTGSGEQMRFSVVIPLRRSNWQTEQEEIERRLAEVWRCLWQDYGFETAHALSESSLMLKIEACGPVAHAVKALKPTQDILHEIIIRRDLHLLDSYLLIHGYDWPEYAYLRGGQVVHDFREEEGVARNVYHEDEAMVVARLYDFQDCQRISEAEYLEALSSYAHLPFAYHGSYMAYKNYKFKGVVFTLIAGKFHLFCGIDEAYFTTDLSMFNLWEETRQCNCRVMEVRFRYDHLPMMRLLTGEILYIDVVLEKYGEKLYYLVSSSYGGRDYARIKADYDAAKVAEIGVKMKL